MTLSMAIDLAAVGRARRVQIRSKRDESGGVRNDILHARGKDPVPRKVRLDEECLMRKRCDNRVVVARDVIL